MSATGQSKVLGNERKYFEEKLGERRKHFEEGVEYNTELLPKLPNDVTVQLICTKLPWRTFYVLSSVSHAWLGAIRSGEIHDTRVRSGTAETLAFLECSFPDMQAYRCAMALYSLRDKAVYRLPTIPPFGELHTPLHSGCVTVDGKVYALGLSGTEMWVLDVARQKNWQQCASMQTLRMNFGCAVFEGKIYVFGGYTYLRTSCGTRVLSEQPIDFSEVYDPKVDAWTKISPMKSWRRSYEAWAGRAFRDEVLVDGGDVYHPGYRGLVDDWRPIEMSRDGIEAYNPAKDSWRTISPGDFGEHELQDLPVEDFGNEMGEKVFTAHGRLHFLSGGKISVIDLDKKSVESLHECSFITRSSHQCHWGPFWPDQVLVTNDGLLIKGSFDCRPPFNKCRLYQSGTIKLGSGKKKILLEEVECSPLVSFFHFSCMEPIQL